MIKIETIREIDCRTKEGELLIAALAILTSLDKEDVREGMWGGMVHPDDALQRVADLANKIYYEEEWKSEEILRKRDEKISKIISEESN